MNQAIPNSEPFNAAQYFIDRNLTEGRGDSTAVIAGKQQLTYREVAMLVSRAANTFANGGVAHGDRVLLLLLDSPAFVAAFWGAIKLGAVPVPANTLLRAEDYEFMLRDSGARGLVVDERLLGRIRPALDHLTAHRAKGEGRWGPLEVVWVVSETFAGRTGGGHHGLEP